MGGFLALCLTRSEQCFHTKAPFGPEPKQAWYGVKISKKKGRDYRFLKTLLDITPNRIHVRTKRKMRDRRNIRQEPAGFQIGIFRFIRSSTPGTRSFGDNHLRREKISHSQ